MFISNSCCRMRLGWGNQSDADLKDTRTHAPLCARTYAYLYAGSDTGELSVQQVLDTTDGKKEIVFVLPSSRCSLTLRTCHALAKT